MLIAGSRTWSPVPEAIDVQLDLLGIHKTRITEAVSGAARGADEAGEAWATVNGLPIKRFPADWNTHGKAAGILRNQEMADYADVAIVFWRQQSSGSANMIANMVARDKPVRVVRPGVR